jgi:DNA end-binding protein Ku
LKISLVTVPVRVYTALNNGEKITFNQLHKGCHQRVRQKLVCPVHGEVERENIVKGYEYAEQKFVTMDEADLEKVRLETTATLDLVQFVRPEELDPLLLDAPYYVGPDGPVAEEGFGVLREALRRAKLIGIGRVVLSGKEKLVALKPLGKGFVFFVLRYLAEVRPANDYFQDLPEQKPDETQVALAQQLIASKSAPFHHAAFTDRYQSALLEVIKAKIQGTEPVLVPRHEVDQVISLMDALRQSVAQSDQNLGAGANGGASPISRNGNGRGSRLKGLARPGTRERTRSVVPRLKESDKR